MGGASSGTALFRNNSSPRLLQFKAALPASKQILMARKAKKVNLSEDLRCFENPYLSDAACNHPGAAVGKVHWP